ncbi:reactive intermediate/imine deaminase [Aquimarina amphilecti]|uniref:Reactive intermediate/imine deaminase n=1 Tax=Aquimarina amphilecti TaxID=1038014 RepID=A0A1H7WDM1_AQUAM|nr:RidA family protein [Aquimarina amphilecti]SEM19570.1 reactive intermediate/imine deaminase [Aquimarina amphilecti]
MKKIYLVLMLVISLFGCTPNSGSNTSITFHETHEPKKSNAPFSDAVQVGNLYFLSGQVGMDHSTRKLVTGGIEQETKQTLENIKDVLKHHDMDMSDVVKCTVILSDINDFSAFNKVYKTYFPQKPARTTFAAKGLAVGAKIEIECVAVKN